jgi:sn-glycerol 3-phosphate transport system substrate-binding protein
MSPTHSQRVVRRRPSRRISFLLGTLGALALIAGACSSGDDGGDADGGSGGSSGDPTEVNADNCPAGALEDAEGPVDITVWHAYNALTQQTLEQAAADYNASQDKVVVKVEAQGTYEEILKKYEDSLADPASLPDVIFSEDTTLQFMIDSGSVIAAGDCVAADPDAAAYYDDLLPAVRNAYSVRDVLWPGAFGVSMPMMYVNNAHLAAAGVDTTTYPGTLAEVRAAAEKIKAAGVPGVEEPVVMQLYGWYPENWLTGAQQPIVDNGNGHDGLATTSEFDNESTTEIVEWLQQMQNDGLLRAYPQSGGIDQFLAMATQTSSILIDGSRAITTVNAFVQDSYSGDDIEGAEGLGDVVQGLDFGVGPIPGLDEPGQGAVAGSAAYLVAGSDDVSVAAGWDFLKFFNTPAVQSQWTLQGSYLPVTESVQSDPAIVDYFTNNPAGQWLSIVNEQLLSVDPDFPGPVIGPYNQFRTGLHAALEQIVLGGADATTTIGDFNDTFQSELDQYADEVGG